LPVSICSDGSTEGKALEVGFGEGCHEGSTEGRALEVGFEEGCHEGVIDGTELVVGNVPVGLTDGDAVGNGVSTGVVEGSSDGKKELSTVGLKVTGAFEGGVPGTGVGTGASVRSAGRLVTSTPRLVKNGCWKKGWPKKGAAGARFGENAGVS
jgi:hypothetical protein